ncbi:MAG TPA: type II CAAX endopeptidase family protein [Candidatus Sulfotelmatobacter sp.]|nr:type II CAAX endopeptidase family protein [Candidatus Sulfotelmatobacter sp.]
MSSDPVLLPAGPSLRSQPSTLRKVFIGQEGLRAGWSFLIFILLFGVVVSLGIFAFQRLHLFHPPTKTVPEISMSFGFINEGITVFAVLLATWIMSRIERRGRSYGYGGTNKLKLFLAGLATGVALISLLVLTLWKSGALVFETRLIFGPDVARYAVLWLLAFVLVGVSEESLTRGFLLYTLTRGLAWVYRYLFKTRHSATLGFWTAAAIMSVIFFLGHTNNPGESPIGLLSVFVGGMFFCYSVWRTGSLWWGIGMHAAWDWGQSFLYGVADSGLMVQHRLLATHPQGKPLLSGGTTGPEGSILIFAVLALGSLIVFLTLPRGRYYDPPPLPESSPPETAVS